MNNKLSSLTLVLLVILFSCKKDDASGQDMSVTMLNVSYGTNTQQKMDVYLPATRSTAATKVIIMIHGGGWNTGDKADFNEYVDSLKKREPSYAIFNINYRLANTPDLFPAQEQDVKAALCKVSFGEADAALVYRTDVKSSKSQVDGIEFPESAQALNDYRIVALKASKNLDLANEFVKFIESPSALAELTAVGFQAP